MKKRFTKFILTALVMVSILAACGISTPGPTPYGVWQNETLGLTLNITEPIELEQLEERFNGTFFRGTYVIDGVETEVFIIFSPYTHEFDIFDALVATESVDQGRESYFHGTFKFDDEELRYNVIGWWEEKTGIPEIIFTKIEDYTPEEK